MNTIVILYYTCLRCRISRLENFDYSRHREICLKNQEKKIVYSYTHLLLIFAYTRILYLSSLASLLLHIKEN